MRAKARAGDLRLKRWIRNQDLREVTHTRLEQMVRKLKLEESEAVLFTNAGYSRARMVLVSDGLPLLVMFPTDEGRRVLARMFVAALQWVSRNCQGGHLSIDSVVDLSAPALRVVSAA